MFHIVDGFVNDAVVPNIDAAFLDGFTGRCIGSGIEPDDDRVRGVELGELTTIERPILVEGYCALARLRGMEGQFEGALALLDKAERAMRLWQGDAGEIPALRVRIWLRQARIEDQVDQVAGEPVKVASVR